MFRPLIAGIVLATSTPAFAQTGAPTGALPSTYVELVPGASPFTEAEARRTLEKNGYSNIQGLKIDQDGIWRGSARKHAKAVEFGLDYKGHIADYPL